jgi:hypothetical protein
MRHLLQAWRIRNIFLAGLATACVLAMIPTTGNAAPSGDQFSVRLGRGSIGYSTYGRGRYGYGNGIGNGFSGNRGNAFPLYGRGPYGYQNSYQNGYQHGYQHGYRYNNGYDTGYGHSRYSGWNPNYNTYSPYTGNYHTPYSTWTYSPFGFGVQQSYGW